MKKMRKKRGGSANAFAPVQEAVAFAARAHQGQRRKDGVTPYVSHAFRVCLVVRDLFGVADRRVLAAAVLHDTVEDTTTDHDDLAERFGPEVADWVAALSKDKRLPHAEREAAYCRVLTQSPWPVQVCKLGDVYDNLSDAAGLPGSGRERVLANARRYLAALKEGLKPEAAAAWETVAALLREMEAAR
jgi:guanosine-3',5'-bis(diphosphate) 3'-pyrophosphohydrolase